jgi:predicted RNA-binding protein YlxR (DUF448 family)
VACRSARPKRELVRLVRTGGPKSCHSERSEESRGGAVEIDVTGKKPGRGAYLCRDRACWEKALKGAGLEKALRCNLTRENRERLMEKGQKILEELTSA